MEWDKIWALNKNSIDPIAPRYTAIVQSSAVKLVIDNVDDKITAKSVPLHPKNEALGSKALLCGKTVWVE
jgi:glutamyl/glutaminyl-tRNA synthetase